MNDDPRSVHEYNPPAMTVPVNRYLSHYSGWAQSMRAPQYPGRTFVIRAALVAVAIGGALLLLVGSATLMASVAVLWAWVRA